MAHTNHYETLKVNQNASQAEIKQAYRHLVKLFHPDTHQDLADHEQIIRINAAYEVLGDAQNRRSYDKKLHQSSEKNHRDRTSRTAAAQEQYQARRKTGKHIDEQVDEWLRLIYQPVNRLISGILDSLQEQIEQLSADPFDDELLEQFQDYLKNCRDDIERAQAIFRSLPNPPSLARSAAHLYYSLNHIGDGLDDLEYFPLNYDESYLHTGQEMFRIASRLYCEAQDSVNAYV